VQAKRLPDEQGFGSLFVCGDILRCWPDGLHLSTFTIDTNTRRAYRSRRKQGFPLAKCFVGITIIN
jgi:hypothetical protein